MRRHIRVFIQNHQKRRIAMHEKLKAAFSRLSALAAAYLPSGYKETLLEMAMEIDRLRAEINDLKGK